MNTLQRLKQPEVHQVGWVETRGGGGIFRRIYVVKGKRTVILFLSSSLWPDSCVETCIYFVEEVLGRIYNAYVLLNVLLCSVRKARDTN
jgi:hypothetical protein